jgi:hypothetical protein
VADAREVALLDAGVGEGGEKKNEGGEHGGCWYMVEVEFACTEEREPRCRVDFRYLYMHVEGMQSGARAFYIDFPQA